MAVKHDFNQSIGHCAHMRENVNQSVTEMGRLNVQKYILLDKNLRSDLEQLVLQRLSFDLFAGSQRSMPFKHSFNKTNFALISVETLVIFQLKWIIYMSKKVFCLIKSCALIQKAPYTALNVLTFLLAVNTRCLSNMASIN